MTQIAIDFKKYIRSVEDHPNPGITFYDITTLILDPEGFRLSVDALEESVRAWNPDKLLAVESRGFVFAAALADRLGLGTALARKPGKLPGETISAEYELEYGHDKLELHRDAIGDGERVVVVDDLIATGGTLKASCQLVEKLGGEVVGIASVVELSFLPWREKLEGYNVTFLVSYDSE